VHLDMPRWFHHREDTPCLATLARAVQASRRVKMSYGAPARSKGTQRIVDPVGLVNKAGVWYVVARTTKGYTVFRASRIQRAELTDESFARSNDFDLATYWDAWSAEFAASRPRLDVTVRASPHALSILPEILGDPVRAAIDAAGPEDELGWRRVALTFEHVSAAAYRLSGFSDLIEVLGPTHVREAVIDYARRTLTLYRLDA
jgi:predicted DNA-binding transcriptional regulator YafY